MRARSPSEGAGAASPRRTPFHTGSNRSHGGRSGVRRASSICPRFQPPEALPSRFDVADHAGIGEYPEAPGHPLKAAVRVCRALGDRETGGIAERCEDGREGFAPTEARVRVDAAPATRGNCRYRLMRAWHGAVLSRPCQRRSRAEFDETPGSVPDRHDCFRVSGAAFDANPGRIIAADLSCGSTPRVPVDGRVDTACRERIAYGSEPDGQVREIPTFGCPSGCGMTAPRGTHRTRRVAGANGGLPVAALAAERQTRSSRRIAFRQGMGGAGR